MKITSFAWAPLIGKNLISREARNSPGLVNPGYFCNAGGKVRTFPPATESIPGLNLPDINKLEREKRKEAI